LQFEQQKTEGDSVSVNGKGVLSGVGASVGAVDSVGAAVGAFVGAFVKSLILIEYRCIVSGTSYYFYCIVLIIVNVARDTQYI